MYFWLLGKKGKGRIKIMPRDRHNPARHDLTSEDNQSVISLDTQSASSIDTFDTQSVTSTDSSVLWKGETAHSSNANMSNSRSNNLTRKGAGSKVQAGLIFMKNVNGQAMKADIDRGLFFLLLFLF